MKHSLVVFSLLFLGACPSSSEADLTVRLEAKAVFQTYQQWYSTDKSDDRAVSRALLQKLPCHGTVCGFRDECSKYADAIDTANALADDIKAMGPVDAGGNGAARDSELLVMKRGAQRQLREAQNHYDLCQNALTSLAAMLKDLPAKPN
jgi:hypothetical protein